MTESNTSNNTHAYKSAASIIHDYLPEKLISFFEKHIQGQESAMVIIDTYDAKVMFPDITVNSDIEAFVALSLFVGEATESSIMESYKIFKSRYNDTSKNWFRPLQAEYEFLKGTNTDKIGPRNPMYLEKWADSMVFVGITGNEVSSKTKEQYIDDIYEKVTAWRSSDTLLIEFPFILSKPPKSIGNAFFVDLTMSVLMAVHEKLDDSIFGASYRVPNQMTEYPLVSYRSTSMFFDVSTLESELAIVNEYDFEDDSGNAGQVIVSYTPEGKDLSLMPSIGKDKASIQKALKKYDINLEQQELDPVDNDIMIRLFTLIRADTINDRYVETKLSDFVKKVYGLQEAPRKRYYEDFQARLVKLRSYDYKIIIRDKKTEEIVQTTSMGLLEYVTVNRKDDILQFIPSQKWIDQYLQRAFVNISQKNYSLIQNRQARLIFTILEPVRIAAYSVGDTKKTLTLKYFRSRMKLYNIRPASLVKEISKQLDYLINAGVSVESYEVLSKNSAFDITFLPLTEQERLVYKLNDQTALPENNIIDQ